MNSKGRKEINLKSLNSEVKGIDCGRKKNESPEKGQVIWQSQEEASMSPHQAAAQKT
jgi:hypothetical protein